MRQHIFTVIYCCRWRIHVRPSCATSQRHDKRQTPFFPRDVGFRQRKSSGQNQSKVGRRWKEAALGVFSDSRFGQTCNSGRDEGRECGEGLCEPPLLALVVFFCGWFYGAEVENFFLCILVCRFEKIMVFISLL